MQYPPEITVKSLLRYPGGKSRAVKTVLDFIPKNTKKLCSPFIGGGSIELACAAQGIRVHAADAFKPLVEFWKYALKSPAMLSQRVQAYYPLSRTEFYALQKSYIQYKDPVDRAAVFYVLNRSSFSGTTLSGGMSPNHPRFTKSAIERLKKFYINGLSVACADYNVMLRRHEDKLLYLDPPYANGGKLYGKKGDMHEKFNHQKLADTLKKRDGWILSYNDCKMIRELYRGYKFIHPTWTYGMSNNKLSNEVLIVNV